MPGDVTGPAYSFGLGSHTYGASANDVAGNTGSASTTFTVSVTFDSLKALVTSFSTDPNVTDGLNQKLSDAAAATSNKTRGNILNAFVSQVNVQTGKAITPEQAQILITLSDALR